MSKPTDLPVFDTNETDAVAPDATRQSDGFVVVGGVPEKPSYKLFNWLMNAIYKWLAYFDKREQSVTHDITADSDYTLTSAQNDYGRIIITDTGVLLTTTRSIIVNDTERRFIAQNDTAQTLTFKTAAGTGIDVLAGQSYDLYCDGTNVIEV